MTPLRFSPNASKFFLAQFLGLSSSSSNLIASRMDTCHISLAYRLLVSVLGQSEQQLTRDAAHGSHHQMPRKLGRNVGSIDIGLLFSIHDDFVQGCTVLALCGSPVDHFFLWIIEGHENGIEGATRDHVALLCLVMLPLPLPLTSLSLLLRTASLRWMASFSSGVIRKTSQAKFDLSSFQQF